MGRFEELDTLVMKDLVPYTAGGDTIKDIRVGSFEQRHYQQDDKSLNAALWSIYPVDEHLIHLDSDIDTGTKVIRQPSMRLVEQPWEAAKLLPPYGVADLDAGIVEFEHVRVAKNLLTVNRAFLAATTGFMHFTSSLKSIGPVSGLLAQRRKGSKTQALPELLASLNAKKDVANKLFATKKYLQAMKDYVKIIVELYPWSASPLIFTSADAFSTGIAQLESSVWSNMAAAALNLAVKDKNWYMVAMDAAWAVISMRFVTSKILAKGYDRAAKAITGWGVAPKTSDDVKELIALSKKMEAVGAQQGNNVWAHKVCVTEHKGCCEVGEVDVVEAVGVALGAGAADPELAEKVQNAAL
ncbi:hypothetical protein Q8F55_006685 [Vanrija albida]|uniref:Uncharacterized protein n=1 Tax=Vanrija albida TaxID=181172 RepID=A0ABR3PY50_9TREE